MRLAIPSRTSRLIPSASRTTTTAVAALSSLLAASACEQDQRVAAGEVRPAGAAPLPAAAPAPAPRTIDVEATRRRLRESERTSKAARAALTRSVAELDTTFARVEHVEGLLHLLNALDAWAVQEYAFAGEQLLTAADNLERGAKHVHLDPDERALAAATNARAVARRLQQSGDLADDEFQQVTSALDAQLRTLGARITRRPSHGPRSDQ